MHVSTLLIIFVALSSCSSITSPSPGPTSTALPSVDGDIIIKLVDADTIKPLLKGATVRVISPQEGNKIYQIDDDGNNKLAIFPCTSNQFIAVWIPGYYIFSAPCDITKKEYTFPIRRVAADNAPGYAWVGEGNGAQNCKGCHSASSGRTESEEWEADGHSKVFVDPYFWTMYMGIDIYRRS